MDADSPAGFPAADVLVPALLRAWSHRLGAQPAWERLSERNFVFRVRGGGREWVLKEAGLVDPQADKPVKLASDWAVLRHLAAQGVPVALPEPTGGGLPALWLGERAFTLTPLLPSNPSLPADPARLYRNIGAEIGRLHRALASYPGQIRSWRMDLAARALDDMVPIILRHLDPPESARLEQVAAGLRGPLVEHLRDLPCQHIHGDCHSGNLLRAGETVTGFIDLDHLPYGPRAYDLAYYLGLEAIHLDPAGEEEWLSARIPNLLAGYSAVIPLEARERAAIPYLMLAMLLLMIGWLFEPLGIDDWAREDVPAFHRVYALRERIQASAQKVGFHPIV